MKTVQLIKVTTKTVYLKDGEVIEFPTDLEKIKSVIFEMTKTMRTVEVIEIWRVKTKKDAELKFWLYMEEHNLNPDDFFTVY
jgi:hypothetical protein